MAPNATPRAPNRWQILLFPLLALVLLFCPRTDARAGNLAVLWQDDFDDARANGWNLQTYTRGDILRVDNGLSAKCDDYYLHGRSLDENGGAGFRAESPTFKDMGLNLKRTYRMSFNYRLPNEKACWTYALASKHLTLVISECDLAAGRAAIGAVDVRHQNFQPIAFLELDTWYRIEAVVDPDPLTGAAVIDLRVDGMHVATIERDVPSAYDRILMMDLPVRLATSDPLDPPAAACFGSGYWDDFEVAGHQSDRPRGKPTDHFRVEPTPFNPRTEVIFDSDFSVAADVAVFDLLGRRVRHLFQGRFEIGPNRIPWDGRDETGARVASGVYVIRATTPGESQSRNAVLVR